MIVAPTLVTPRLQLRPFTPADAPRVQLLASDADVALMTATIPHPYPPGAATAWIATHAAAHASGEALHLAITSAEDGVIGALALRLEPAQDSAELGYWIGKPHWSRGYATEAARAFVRHGFAALGLQRIHAHHMSRNPASGRVLAKIGMQHEGRHCNQVCRPGNVDDIERWSVQAADFAAFDCKGRGGRA